MSDSDKDWNDGFEQGYEEAIMGFIEAMLNISNKTLAEKNHQALKNWTHYYWEERIKEKP